MTIPIPPVIVAAIIQVTSPAFKNNDFIPQRFSCEGENISPAIKIKKIPDGTKTLAIILFDPDASPDGFVHWVLWNLPPSSKIPEKITIGAKGNNGNGEIGYTGPCPPDGIHHYIFSVYALDTKLNLPETSGKKELEAAMRGHILAQGTITGLYKKIK
jgi:Raf kinase inhibitor-like YbhB/YbcL family protein